MSNVPRIRTVSDLRGRLSVALDPKLQKQDERTKWREVEAIGEEILNHRDGKISDIEIARAAVDGAAAALSALTEAKYIGRPGAGVS